ncbi:unnamed protein product [Ophioblennius macclurei]
MTESSFRSRLKRKQCEERSSSFRSNFRSAEGLVWWKQLQLPAEEQLWALALKSALPLLKDQRWDPVPDLPQPCAVAAATGLDEQGGCDLATDAPPFPDPLTTTTSLEEVPDPADVRPLQNLHGWEEEQQEEEGLAVQRSPLQRKREHGEEVQECSRTEAGSGILQSCPMCLLLFPVGFTQFECDSHLCQCLSDMNVDMTW